MAFCTVMVYNKPACGERPAPEPPAGQERGKPGMPRRERTVIEYRSYELPAHFPMIYLGGEQWRISDRPEDVLHFHNCLEIGLCESDSGTLRFEGETRAFRAGDVTVIAGDVPHTTWSAPGTASRWSYLFADPEELLRPFFSIDMLPNSQLFSDLMHGWYAVLRPEDYPGVAAAVRSIVREMTDRRLNYEISVRGMFLVFVTELMRIHAQNGRASANGAMVIAPALDYINRHYMEDFTIGVLAETCSMSQSHFRRVFHELMGISPLEQLNRTRIMKACSLLRMTEHSILSVSEMVGFRSVSSFNRHFSSAMGISPSEYRRAVGGGRSTSILKYSGWLTPPHQE